MDVAQAFCALIHQHAVLMIVYVNDKPTELLGKTVADLVEELHLPQTGIAVAKGQDIVPRPDWAQTFLSEGDRLIVIRAASGG